MRADSGPLLRANMVIMQRNIDQFAVICQELATWGFDEISFNQLGGLDRPEFYPENRIQVDQWHRFREQLPNVRASLADQGVMLAGSEAYLDRLEATTCERKMPIDECYPGEEFWFIDEQGRLSPCSYTSSIYSLMIEDLDAADLRTSPNAYKACAARQQLPHVPTVMPLISLLSLVLHRTEKLDDIKYLSLNFLSDQETTSSTDALCSSNSCNEFPKRLPILKRRLRPMNLM